MRWMGEVWPFAAAGRHRRPGDRSAGRRGERRHAGPRSPARRSQLGPGFAGLQAFGPAGLRAGLPAFGGLPAFDGSPLGFVGPSVGQVAVAIGPTVIGSVFQRRHDRSRVHGGLRSATRSRPRESSTKGDHHAAFEACPQLVAVLVPARPGGGAGGRSAAPTRLSAPRRPRRRLTSHRVMGGPLLSFVPAEGRAAQREPRPDDPRRPAHQPRRERRQPRIHAAADQLDSRRSDRTVTSDEVRPTRRDRS